jgi:hypothetical protein
MNNQKKSISIYSEEAGARVTFEFDNDLVQPTEALANLFATAIYKMLQENPWRNGPTTPVALAWSLSSLVIHAAQVANEKDKMSTEEFIDIVIDAVENFYMRRPRH